MLKKNFPDTVFGTEWKNPDKSNIVSAPKIEKFVNYSSKIIFFGEDEKEHGSGLQCCGAGAGLFSWIRSQ